MAQHVMKLLLQVAIRPHISIELFLLPDKSALLSSSLILCAENDLIECIKSLGQKKMLPLSSLFLATVGTADAHGQTSRRQQTVRSAGSENDARNPARSFVLWVRGNALISW
jgi:hypothetical protein